MTHVFTIPPERPFLDALAAGLLAEGRERLARTLLLLPSRRACIAARDAFLRASEGSPCLLPRMRPVGEVDEDESLLDPALELELPPAIGGLERRLLLTKLIVAKRNPIDGREIPYEQAVRLAGELAALLDELGTEGASLAGLASVGPVELDLAAHWERTLTFLRLLETQWPALLATHGRLDPTVRRDRLLRAQAASWRDRTPDHPIVAAGTIASVPAVAELLAAVAGLPDGRVVLPNLDRALEEAVWATLGPSHPQSSMHGLLERLNLDRAAVLDWPAEASATPHAPPALAALWREVMRPAGDVAPPTLSADTVAGVTLAVHQDLATEAVDLALRIREALETPGRTVALVTAERTLARRVASELARWDIAVEDTGGVPLDQTPPGSFLLLTARALLEGDAGAVLLAALKHPLATAAMPMGELRRHVRSLELAVMRGPRIAGGLAGLAAALRERDPDRHWTAPVPATELGDWLDRLRAITAPLTALGTRQKVSLALLLDLHVAVAEQLAAEPEGGAGSLWDREAGVALAAFVSELRAAAGSLGDIAPDAYVPLLSVLMGGVTVRGRRPGHPRVAILGRIESRLASADLVLLGGLIEGSWPRAAVGGPWLNRAMRKAIGLPPAEQAIGIAAHDLVMAGSAPEIVLSRSGRDAGGKPVIPSRWLVRLEALLDSVRLRDAVTPAAGRALWPALLDGVHGRVRPCAQPRPGPPAPARPRRLSATDLRDLMADPWRVYVRRVLKLVELEPIDAEPGPAERGRTVHKAIERFVLAYPTALPDDPLGVLEQIGAELFAPLGHHAHVQALWRPRFREIARWIVAQEAERRALPIKVVGEVDGKLAVGGVTITARADRIEITGTGELRVIDYKTGSLPKADAVRRGLEPQLPIELLMALEGGFPGVPAGPVTGLLLWSLRGDAKGGLASDPTWDGKAKRAALTIEELAERSRAGLAQLVEHFSNDGSVYLAMPRPDVARRGDGYEHLSRLAEWYAAGPDEVGA